MRIWKAGDTYSGFSVTMYDTGMLNASRANRIDTVTSIASIAYGRDRAKNPEALYDRLKKLKHESLWEFIRCAPLSRIQDSMRNLGRMDESYPFDLCPECARSKIALFRLRVPIFIARQIMRHRSFTFLEMSRRYVKDKIEIWYPPEVSQEDRDVMHLQYRVLLGRARRFSRGDEIANRYLPTALFTEFYMMGDTDAFRSFFNLRLAKDAQKETREVATLMRAMLPESFVDNMSGESK